MPVLDLAVQAEKEGAEAVAAFGDFLYKLVPEDQHVDFRRVMNQLDLETLVELATWIMEEATGRPLPSASSSPPEPFTDTPPSRVVSLSPVAEAH